MDSLEIYKRFTDFQRKTGLSVTVIAEKFRINKKTLLARLFCLHNNTAGEQTRQQTTAMLDLLEKEYENLTPKCEVCGKPFIIEHLNVLGRKKTCSEECRRKKHSRYMKEYRKTYETTLFLNCIVCGKEYTGTKNSMFCSEGCRAEARKSRYTNTCKYCGEPIIVNRVFCSERCKTNYYSELAKKKRHLQKSKDFEWKDIDKVNETLAKLENGLF